jgi:Xaa-Pro dipeptidase
VSIWGEPAFSRAEYERRVRAVQCEMERREIDVLLCHHFPNVCYLTGMESVLWRKYFLCVVPRAGEPTLVAESFELPNARYSVWWEDLVGFELGADPVDVTRLLLEALGLEDLRIGLERAHLTVPLYEALVAALSSATLIDASDMVDGIKVIKSEPEIEHIRTAAAITDAGMMAALEQVSNGSTDQQVAAAAYSALITGGSEFMALDPIVTVGPRSGIPHSSHRRVTIAPGDTVLVELGANIHRYTAALFRTAVVGTPTEEIERMASATIRSLGRLIAGMMPGAIADQVARAADEVWQEETSEYLWHGIYAYSLGIGFPIDWNDCLALIERGSTLILQPGMVFHCTTSLRKPNYAATAFSETVLVTEHGPEVLTSVPRELVVA